MESIKQIGSKVVASVTAVALCGTLSFGFVANQPAQAYADDLAATSLSTQANGPAVDAVNDNYGRIILSHWDASENLDDYQNYDQTDTTGSPQTTLYNSYNMADGISVNGISYKKATNTITLEKADDPTGILHITNMGEDLKIVVKDTNSLGAIEVYGRAQGASLDISGDGTLNLNKSKYELGTALYVDGGTAEVRTPITKAQYDAGQLALNNAITRNWHFEPVSYDTDEEWQTVTETDEYGYTYTHSEWVVTAWYKVTQSKFAASIKVADTVNLNAYSGDSSRPVVIEGTTLGKSKALQFEGATKSKDAFTYKAYGQRKIISSVDFTAAYTTKYGHVPGYYDDEEDYVSVGSWYDPTTRRTWNYDNNTKRWYRWSTNKADVAYKTYSYAGTVFSQTATETKVGKLVYSVKDIDDKTVTVKKVVKGKKTVTIPKKVEINGKKFAVTGIDKKAFKTSKKTKTLKIETKKLTKKSVKKSLKGSKIKTVKVPKKCLDDYTKYFAKKNCGKKVTVK